jgi:addiction module HigA family antidote
VIHGRRNIIADTALRLGRWFSVSANFWMNLQKSYELRKSEQEHGADVERIQLRLEVAI